MTRRRISIHVGSLNDPRPVAATPVTCQHMGEVLKVVACELCGSRGKPIEIRACAIHGRCSRSKWKANQPERCCVGCEDGPWA